MNVTSFLENYGLSQHETAAYLALLQCGSATVARIAQHTGIKRTTCYHVLEGLLKEGLISKSEHNAKQVYIAEDPGIIHLKLAKQRHELDDILPQLRGIYRAAENRPRVKFYDGVHGVWQGFNDMLNYPNSTVLSFSASEDEAAIVGTDAVKEFIALRAAKKIRHKSIMRDSETIVREYAQKAREQLREVRLLDPLKYPCSVEIDIYGGDKVAQLSLRDGVGIIIESKQMHDTWKSLFMALWDTLPAYDSAIGRSGRVR